MEMYYIVTDIPRWLLCERVVRTANGYLLYEYDPDNDIYRDSGYAFNLESLRFIISARYDWRKTELFLLRSFEEVARMFTSRFPRIIHIGRGVTFCIRTGDVLFNVKWDYDADGNFFVKKFEWLLGGEEPGSIKDALERLNDYAEKRNTWILFRERIKEATAYEVYPSP